MIRAKRKQKKIKKVRKVNKKQNLPLINTLDKGWISCDPIFKTLKRR